MTGTVIDARAKFQALQARRSHPGDVVRSVEPPTPECDLRAWMATRPPPQPMHGDEDDCA